MKMDVPDFGQALSIAISCIKGCGLQFDQLCSEKTFENIFCLTKKSKF